MARCYANENFPFPTVEVLRGLGHDVLTTVESGRAGQAIPDVEVLAFAVAEERIVITLTGGPRLTAGVRLLTMRRFC